MTRNELAWLIIRSIGLVLLWEALSNVGSFGFAAYMMTVNGYEELRASLSSRLSWDLAWPKAFAFLIYGLAAFYFLRRGVFVYRLLVRGSSGLDEGTHSEHLSEPVSKS